MKDNNEENLPQFGIIRENEERRDGGCAFVYDPETKLFAVGKQPKRGIYRLFSGGVSEEEDIVEGILREVVEESGLYDFSKVENLGEVFTHYHNVLKNVNRCGKSTCILVVLKSKNLKETQLEAHEEFTLTWQTAKEILDNWNSKNQEKDLEHWIYFWEKAMSKVKELGYSE